MSLFNLRSQFASGGATYNPFENPAVPLASVGLDNMFGQANSNDSGESVTEDRSLTLPTVYRCVALISGIIAGCPLNVYRSNGKAPVTVPVLDPMNASTLYTQYELWELVLCHLMLWGNAYLVKVKNGVGQVVDLRPIWPGRVAPRINPKSGNKEFVVRPIDGAVGADNIVYTTDQVMHIPGLGYDGLAGIGVIGYARQTIGTALASDKLAARFYSNGTQLTGILKTAVPLTSQDQADEMKRTWLMKNGGTGNSSGVAVLDSETEYQALTIPPDQLQFLESRRWQTTEIARLFGIPPHLVGDVEKSTSWGSGIEQQNTAFVAYTLAAWANRIEQRVTREVVQTRGQTASFDFSSLLRGDMQERFTAYSVGIQWGFLTRNEARLREDMEPINGLDEPLQPLNMLAGSTSTEKLDPNVKPLGATGQPGSGKTQAVEETPDESNTHNA